MVDALSNVETDDGETWTITFRDAGMVILNDEDMRMLMSLTTVFMKDLRELKYELDEE